MQVAHHLFPRTPRPLLRALTERVKVWAAQTPGVFFEERTFSASNGKLNHMLRDVWHISRWSVLG